MKTVLQKSIEQGINLRKYDLAIRLAKRVLALPDGGWPETEQAYRDLDDALPEGFSVEDMLALARAAIAKATGDGGAR